MAKENVYRVQLHYYKVEQSRVHLELRSNKLVTGTMTIQFIVQIRKQKGEPLINIYTN